MEITDFVRASGLRAVDAAMWSIFMERRLRPRGPAQ